jgi:nucleoside-diphosphate-sugar epimerase
MTGEPTTLVTGGAGYIGAPLSELLARTGRRVRVLDVLLHGQGEVADSLARSGVELITGDIRDADARRSALQGVDAIVHLAAIVGDPACARDPALSNAVNVEATGGLLADARDAGVRRFVFRSRKTASSHPSRCTPSRRWRSSGCC